MKIERMNEKNMGKYIEIYQDVFKREPWFINESDNDIKEYFLKYFKLNNFLGYEILVDDEIKGFCLGLKKPWIEGYEYFIDQICILHKEQRQGYGGEFLELVDEYLYEEEVVSITLLTDRYTGAYKFYSKNKFENLKEYTMFTKEI